MGSSEGLLGTLVSTRVLQRTDEGQGQTSVGRQWDKGAEKGRITGPGCSPI